MEKYNLGIISKNRSTIYSISILWIMLFHSTFEFNSSWMAPLSRIKSLGNCGVDIFLLVSGISLYFSLTKSNNIPSFFRRRFHRILLPVMIITIPWCAAYLIYFNKFSIETYLLDITGISLFVRGYRTLWFIYMIILCYLIYPVLYWFLKRFHHSPLCLISLLSACFMFNFTIRILLPDVWENSEILFRRIPIFIIGAYMGKYVYEKRVLKTNNLLVSIFSILLFLLYSFARQYWLNIIPHRYMYIPLAIGSTVLFSLLGNIEIINRIASSLSPFTLEIFLCHEKTLLVLSIVLPNLITISNNFINIVSCILSIVFAYLLAQICRIITIRMNYRGSSK